MSIPPRTIEPVAAARPDNPAAKLFGLVLLVALIGGGLAAWKQWGAYDPLGGGAQWEKSLATGLNAAQASGKPAFVLFTANWCPPCRDLKRTVLSEPEVLASLEERFVLIKVDLSDRHGPNKMIAKQYQVRSIPTVILFNRRGEELTRVSGGESLAIWILRHAS